MGEQTALVEEDEDAGLKLEGFPDTEIPKILEAMGDDGAEVVPGSPGGTSATGADGSPITVGSPSGTSLAAPTANMVSGRTRDAANLLGRRVSSHTIER